MKEGKLKLLKESTKLIVLAKSVGINPSHLSRILHGSLSAGQSTAELLAIKANQITQSKIYTAEDFQQEKP